MRVSNGGNLLLDIGETGWSIPQQQSMFSKLGAGIKA
jgi:hypothetical protein